jgi:gluconokinase
VISQHLPAPFSFNLLDSAIQSMETRKTDSLVIMGVAGCGKSTVGAALAQALAMPLVEGDDFHSPASRDKMNRGIALTDADRESWLATLGDELRRRPGGAVLTCSALKRSYRERLRAAAPGLRFVFLDIARDEALRRVAARASSHFFSATLVDSQFATLESPVGEAGVLRVDACRPIAQLRAEVLAWLPAKETP